MAHLLVEKILEGMANVKKDGSAYLLAEELEAAAYISLGNEVLQIPRLQRIESFGSVTLFTTYKAEKYYFPPEQLVGLKFGGPDAKSSRVGAGFR